MTRRDFIKDTFSLLSSVGIFGLFQNITQKSTFLPVKDSLIHKATEKKILLVKELPEGALSRYERDINAKSWVISKRGIPIVVQE